MKLVHQYWPRRSDRFIPTWIRLPGLLQLLQGHALELSVRDAGKGLLLQDGVLIHHDMLAVRLQCPEEAHAVLLLWGGQGVTWRGTIHDF